MFFSQHSRIQVILDDGHQNLLNTESVSIAESYFGEKQQLQVDSPVVPSRFSIRIVFSGLEQCVTECAPVCGLYMREKLISQIYFLALKGNGAFINA